MRISSQPFGIAAFCIIANLTMVSRAAADDLAVCQQRGNNQQVAACTRMIKSDRFRGHDLAALYYYRGNAYVAEGEYDAAITDFTETIRFDPKSAAYMNRGMAYVAKGDSDHAIADETAAIRLDPKDARLYVNRAIAYRGKGDFDRAIADCSAAIRLAPTLAEAYANRGAGYYAKGDYDHAMADETEAIRLNPNDYASYANRCVTYRVKRDFDRAIADCTAAVRLAPTNASVHERRGTAYYASGDVDHAIADYAEATRLDPKRNIDLPSGVARIVTRFLAIPPTAVTWRFRLTAQMDGAYVLLYTPGVAQPVRFEGVNTTKDVPLSGPYLFVVTVPPTAKITMESVVADPKKPKDE